MIRLMIPTTRKTPEDARALRWQKVVTEVREYKVDGRTALLVWETESPEVAYMQLNRLAASLVPAYQVFTDEEEAAHVATLEARYTTV